MKQAGPRAVFLDRDGVVSEDGGRPNAVADLRMLPGVASAVKRFNDSGYRVVMVTNQAAVAKGKCTLEAVHEMNDEIKKRLAAEGASVDAVYFCPHHPEGMVKEYAIACDCRKPATGMIAQAAKDLDIDLAKSFLIGDKTGDILAGQRAGLKTILVRTGYGGSDGLFDVQPDLTANDLPEAAHLILS